ncbi:MULTISPECIES: TylF/MycF/NovP-related O-methyltransferase [unclassified Methanoregula]|uniref:TylF/MycF/NovP-related O-methyltransferase n=1 Tax=unclassified Methanoregula TaxID=2649730 RepID=UPI0009C5B3E4|nr:MULTISPECIES: TylF/MycF/NovP-related O-methyltransferase [unclassified Methanoregula]OPX62280.1 MAG: Macrocin-O-methyltransferase (TylF) [Methanoregula sp. PtaB.Bin085]OPY32707.1 MAG: Macrocin-O-methyltransferase (TylF) [Methanoregula sp. PtaU1.Bin006]
MNLSPKKNLIYLFDSVVPSRYVHKCRRFFFFDPFYGNDLAHRGRLSHYGSDERKAFARELKKIRSETELLIEDIEAYHIYMAVKRTQKVPGDIAEVGVYMGGSAKIICSVKGDRHLHLFDTFEGLPQVDDIDAVWPFYEGKFAASYDKVRDYLRHQENVTFYKGIFPDTSGPVEDKKFSMVNLDVDCYESTKKCLEFFYSRMSKGGIILSHDYTTTPGVRKAFDDFFEDKDEPVLETAGSQCLVVKV